jgi:hypothetical protein
LERTGDGTRQSKIPVRTTRITRSIYKIKLDSGCKWLERNGGHLFVEAERKEQLISRHCQSIMEVRTNVTKTRSLAHILLILGSFDSPIWHGGSRLVHHFCAGFKAKNESMGTND